MIDVTTNRFIRRAGDASVKIAQYKHWDDVRHFEAWEHFGDASKMNLSFMARLDFLREVADRAILINAGWAESGHSHSESFHYSGMAADLVIVQATLQEMFQLAVLCGFRGIGIYPYWNKPGIHVDIRPWEHIATWMRNREGEFVGLPNNYKELLIAA